MDDRRDHLREMMAAFDAATGFTTKMTPFRTRMLRRLHIKGYRAPDVTAVMEELKRRIRVKPAIYDESCLEFGAAIANLEKFQDRANTLRKAALLKPAAKKVPVPAAKPTMSEEDRQRIGGEVARRLADFRKKLLEKDDGQ